MKRVISCLLTVALLLTLAMPVAMAADEKKSGAFTYRIKGNGTVAITGYDWETMEGQDVYIPRMLDGYNVTEIADGAFAELSSFPRKDKEFAHKVKTLVIPDTIKSIGKQAFWNIDFETKTIAIPSSVEYIGAGAFSNIGGVENFVAANNSVYATIDGVLYNKNEKKLIAFPPQKMPTREKDYRGFYEIPEGITAIGDYAFWGVAAEKSRYSDFSVDLPSTLLEIGEYAFAHSLKKNTGGTRPAIEITFPASLKKLGEGVFYNCELVGATWNMSNTVLTEIPALCFYDTYITKILFPKNLKSIHEKAFYYAYIGTHYSDDFTIPSTVTEIHDYAFSHIRNRVYTKVVFPADSQLQSIGEGAFSNSKIGPTMVLPSQLKTIGDFAFKACEELETIVLPTSISKLGEEICERGSVYLDVEPGTYAALYASENGYMMVGLEEDTSWLN